MVFGNVTFGCERGVLNAKVARRVADVLKLVPLSDAGPCDAAVGRTAVRA
jgi:ABC-type Fe3+/spermidine/putrescine transport system ATPase subunit